MLVPHPGVLWYGPEIDSARALIGRKPAIKNAATAQYTPFSASYNHSTRTRIDAA
jgi:hypothetical protein